MNGKPWDRQPRASRRRILRKISGLTTLGILGTGNSNTVAADSSYQVLWNFLTGRRVRSSPTVADGTVFVGSDDANLYAVNAETGNQQWAFTGSLARSSPTVADGTVFVGSDDNNLYA
ncbi:outer membrane protein assembly factor BamB family protein, partial [Salinadaptatus halalkaliphilus]